MSQQQLFLEADRIAIYLIGKLASVPEKKLYVDAMEKLSISLSDTEQRLWNKMLRRKGMMARADAGLALAGSGGNIRRKIFTMLAILETSTEHAHLFLSQRRSPFYSLKIMLVGIRAAFRGITGSIIIRTSWKECI